MRNVKKGAAALFLAAFFYGFYGIFSRLIGTSFGSFNQNWVRNLLVLLIIFVVIYVWKIKLIRLRKQDLKWILLWLLTGSWVTVLSFIAFNNLQIGTAYLILYSAMISAGFLAGKVFFREKLDANKIASFTLCFSGLVLIYSFSLDSDDIFYAALALMSGFMTGIWNTVSKKFSDHYPNSQLVMIDALGSVVAAIFGSFIFKEPLPNDVSIASWICVGVYGVVQTINVALIVYGFKNIEAQAGSIILPVEVVFAALFSFLIFQEVLPVASFFGGLLIISGAILPSIRSIGKRGVKDG